MSTLRRVQRIPSQWPVLHLESEVPLFGSLTIGGLVRYPLTLRLDELQALNVESRKIAVHCVWGWSRPEAWWTGVPMSEVLALAEPKGSFVTVYSASGTYSSCLPIDDAAEGFLAWKRDGCDLAPESGGPLRYLPPPRFWAYKGVKWASTITVDNKFMPGFWESKVEDPLGLIPEEVDLP